MISRWWWGPKTGGELWVKDRSIRSFDGTEIRYTLLGEPDNPLVTFCAGFVCPDTYWRGLVEGLEGDYRLLVWNYRGVGTSGLPREPGFHCRNLRDEDLTIEANARDLQVILDREGADRTALVGHSMGAQTMFEAYRQYPERVEALISIGGAYCSPLRTFYGTDLSARVAPLALPLLHVFPRVTLLAWRALIQSPLAYPAGRHALRAIGPGAYQEEMRGYFEHLSMCDPLIAAKMIRGMHAHSAEDLLEKIDVPTLILHGDKDPFSPPRVAKTMWRKIPGARLSFYEGGSHTLPIERPQELLAEIRPLLAEAFAR